MFGVLGIPAPGCEPDKVTAPTAQQEDRTMTDHAEKVYAENLKAIRAVLDAGLKLRDRHLTTKCLAMAASDFHSLWKSFDLLVMGRDADDPDPDPVLTSQRAVEEKYHAKVGWPASSWADFVDNPPNRKIRP